MAIRPCRLLVAAIVLFGPAVYAQQPTPFASPSALATPQATSVEVIRQQRLDIPVPAIVADLQRSDTLQLALFSDTSLRAIRQRSEPTARGVSWVGVLEGYPSSTVVFVLVGDELIGHIYAPFGFFRIQREAAGGYLVQQVDQGVTPEESDAIIPPAQPDAIGAAEPVTAALDDGATIDILVAYTREAYTAYPSESQALASVDLVIAETNEALRSTGHNTRLRLVRSVVVEYAETGNSSTDLGRLQRPNDGFLDDVLELRDRHAADLVALITERDTAICGRGYVLSPSAFFSTFAFSLTRRVCTGNGRSFAHEIGHNMGAHHDWYETAAPGAFAYSKGYVDLDGRFTDVLAYPNLCRDTGVTCTSLLVYSNPNFNHQGRRAGVPSGTSLACKAGNRENPPCDADIARTFGTMAPLIARYRDSAASISVLQLLPGEGVSSANRQFRLTYQTDGNLVLYDVIRGTALWSSGTGGTTPGRAIMQSDGNFVVYDAQSVPRWNSGTAGNPAAFLLVQDDGNLVVYRTDGRPLWHRHQ